MKDTSAYIAPGEYEVFNDILMNGTYMWTATDLASFYLYILHDEDILGVASFLLL